MYQQFIAFALFCVIVLFACQTSVNKGGESPDGATLAKIHCASCHAYPEPQLLPKATWEQHVLPRMGYMLGIYPDAQTREALIEQGPAEAYVRAANTFPKAPLLDSTLWQKIQGFYLQQAPDSLPAVPALELTALKQFTVEFPDYYLSPPSATLLSIEPDGLYLGDANSKGFYAFDASLNMVKGAKVREGAVSLHRTKTDLLLTVMGSFSPTDAPSGFLLQLPTNGGRPPRILIDSLQRPVHTAFADLNGDGLDDAVISEFAKWTGRLAWWEALPDGNYVPHTLRDMPGAIRTAVRDFNQDGLLDILALFGQGDEGFFLYTNQGDGQFQEERVYRFPASYGSSYFDLFDFNGDAYPDIIYTAGDNADYPPILKPYHGIRILENDGQNGFTERFFYPLHGAYAAIPQDFDGDGDLDIAAISFFPDFQQQPEASFVYLENQGDMQMQAQTFPQSTAGRWIIMDSGDLDGDGDEDLALGSLAFEVVPDGGEVQRWVAQGVPFVVLWNGAE